MFSRKLREEVLKLQYRVQELEELLCPCESHDWVEIAKEPRITSMEVEYLRTYKCKRCGKVIKRYDW